MLSDSEISQQKRKVELAFAGAVSVALIALTFAVTKLAPTYEPIAEVSVASKPIVVFPDFASIPNIKAKKPQFLISCKIMCVMKTEASAICVFSCSVMLISLAQVPPYPDVKETGWLI